MAKRTAIRPRDRFEIFKRDRFTCQYCGGTPPAVILQVDHIVAVAEGGTSDPLNLITACQGCNIGKGARPLDQVTAPIADQIEERRERAEQAREYNTFLLELRQAEEEAIKRLGLDWYNRFHREQNAFVFGPARRPSVQRFLRALPEVEILEAADIAFSRFFPSGENDWKTWKYFCGVCWKKVRRARGEDE